MKKLQWVKRTAILTDVPMAYLLNLGDAYVVIWYMLEDLAALINDDGKIYISPNQPMDIKFLAKLLQRRVTQLEKALDVYESIDLISRDELGNITLLTWHKIQDYARLERQRAQNRERQAAYRQRQSEQQAKQNVLVTETHETASAGAVSLQPVGALPASLAYKQTTAGSTEVAAKTDSTAGEPSEKSSANVQVSISHYEQYWGQVNPLIMENLTEWTEKWGSDAVCTAIDIAKENGTSNINYIRAVLENSNGCPKRKESAYERQQKEIHRILDEVFCECDRESLANGSKERTGQANVSNAPGHDGRRVERAAHSLTQAMQI